MCVTDDESVTTCCTVSVMATPDCSPPPTPTVTLCPTSWDRRPVVEFTPLPAGQTYELFLDGASYATVTAPGQNYHRPATELGVGSAPPGTGGMIHARACLVSEPACCAVSAAVPVNLIASCTTPIAPSASNIVFSEYVINGDGACPGSSCQAGEAIEITNLSHCPVLLDGNHFSYCNSPCTTFRWMNFVGGQVIPPRGVYVAIRNIGESMCYGSLPSSDPGLFGLRVSSLTMESTASSSGGWFVNSNSGSTRLRLAYGSWSTISGGTTYDTISPYLYSPSAPDCSSVGFSALDRCGDIAAGTDPTSILTPNQLGRLWHPCDAVTSPNPPSCM